MNAIERPADMIGVPSQPTVEIEMADALLMIAATVLEATRGDELPRLALSLPVLEGICAGTSRFLALGEEERADCLASVEESITAETPLGEALERVAALVGRDAAPAGALEDDAD